MGRPSKLSESQWEDLLRRLSSGEKAADLARKYRISTTSISKRVSQPAEISKSLAKSLVEVETRIESLPISQQRVIRSLADQLKGLSEDYATAAALGMKTATKLHRIAATKVDDLDETATFEDLRTVAALAETANKSAQMGTNLIAANKGKAESASTLEDLICGESA